MDWSDPDTINIHANENLPTVAGGMIFSASLCRGR